MFSVFGKSAFHSTWSWCLGQAVNHRLPGRSNSRRTCSDLPWITENRQLSARQDSCSIFWSES